MVHAQGKVFDLLRLMGRYLEAGVAVSLDVPPREFCNHARCRRADNEISEKLARYEGRKV